MPKKGYNPFEKQSSTMSNRQLLAQLLANGFEVATRDVPTNDCDIKTAYRKEVRSALREFGAAADISITGRSVRLTNGDVEVEVKLSGMLGTGELAAIQQRTGLKLGE